MHGSYSKWLDYLNQFKIQEQELKTASFEVNACLEQIKKERSRLMSRLFSGTYLVFFKNSSAIDLSSISQLSQDEPPTLSSSLHYQLYQLSEQSLSATLVDYRTEIIAKSLRVVRFYTITSSGLQFCVGLLILLFCLI